MRTKNGMRSLLKQISTSLERDHARRVAALTRNKDTENGMRSSFKQISTSLERDHTRRIAALTRNKVGTREWNAVIL